MRSCGGNSRDGAGKIAVLGGPAGATVTFAIDM
jgi:hypothetical protein